MHFDTFIEWHSHFTRIFEKSMHSALTLHFTYATFPNTQHWREKCKVQPLHSLGYFLVEEGKKEGDVIFDNQEFIDLLFVSIPGESGTQKPDLP